MNEKEDQGYGGLTNVEVYAILSLALMEMEKINAHVTGAAPTNGERSDAL